MLWWWCGVIVVVSLITLIAFGLDKRAARLGRWRTSEKVLLVMCVLGGWPGALIARRVFRHKTRKQPFVALMWLMVTIHVVVTGLVVWWVWSR